MLKPRNTCLSSLPTFLTLYLPRSLLVEAKVVGYLMAHYFLYPYFNFIANAALRLYGLKRCLSYQAKPFHTSPKSLVYHRCESPSTVSRSVHVWTIFKLLLTHHLQNYRTTPRVAYRLVIEHSVTMYNDLDLPSAVLE